MLTQILITLPLIIGAYLILSLLKLPDFSIESAYLFGAVAAFFAQDQAPLFLTLISFLGGLFVGFIVSIFNQYFNLPFLLAAIITNGLFHGLTQYLLGSSMTSFHPHCTIPDMAFFSFVTFSLIVIVGLLLRSQLGYSLAIFGNNPLFFENHRISGRFCLFMGVMIGHGCAGIAGFLFAQANGFIDLTMNFGVILLSLTSLMLGKLIIPTAKPKIFLPLVGTISYFLIQYALLSIGINLKYFNAFQALFILSVLLVGKKRQKSLYFGEKINPLNHLGI